MPPSSNNLLSDITTRTLGKRCRRSITAIQAGWRKEAAALTQRADGTQRTGEHSAGIAREWAAGRAPLKQDFRPTS